jgi:hypothetical protein
MAQTARVTSIDGIKEFRACLCRFGEDVKNGLDAVEMEVRRALDWLLHTQPAYWTNQIKRRKEELSLAQAALFRKKLQAGPGREVKDTEEKEAVRTAQRRVAEAEQKLQIVRKWAPVFQHAVSEYMARARPTGDMLASDLRVSLALLDNMTNALDAYIAMAPPPGVSRDELTAASSSAGGATPSARPGSMANPVDDVEPAPQPAAVAPNAGEEAADEHPPGNPAAGA